jgi:hypothetical protein
LRFCLGDQLVAVLAAGHQVTGGKRALGVGGHAVSLTHHHLRRSLGGNDGVGVGGKHANSESGYSGGNDQLHLLPQFEGCIGKQKQKSKNVVVQAQRTDRRSFDNITGKS